MAIAIAASTVWTLIGPFFGVDDPLEGIPESLVSFVTEMDLITVTIALAAGVAAMAVFISDRARAAVGVGVSITTIPAAAYAGLALADGQFSEAGDALLVLLVNIVAVIAAGVVTRLVLRTHLQHRVEKLQQETTLSVRRCHGRRIDLGTRTTTISGLCNALVDVGALFGESAPAFTADLLPDI
ncbi:MAG: DUF389 domain-containing protein [Actinomycetia bacterium]|nr:DUF389 domain-containing protein [Actinomycetes bacterium]